MSHSGLPVLLLFSLAATHCSSVQDPKEGSLQNGSFTAELSGFRIHYEVHGSGPVLMTLPNSWGITVAGLRPLYRALEGDLTLVYFDPRGMGESDPVRDETDRGMAAVREDFDSLRRFLGLDVVHAIGWSNGAMNLVLLASEKPRTLASAIFLHGAASYSPEDSREFASKYPQIVEAYGTFQKDMAEESLDDVQRTARLRKFWLEELLPLSCFHPEKGRELVTGLLGQNTFSWRHADFSRIEASQFDFTNHLGRISAASLILAGAADSIPLEKARAMARGIPQARLVVFEQSGHYAPAEEPEAFRRAVLDFVSAQEEAQ